MNHHHLLLSGILSTLLVACGSEETTPSAVLPVRIGSPQNLTASIETCSRIHLSWQTGAGNATSFVIEKKSGSANDYVELANVSGSVLSYDDNDVALYGVYSYRLTAKDASGASEPSSSVDVNLSSPPTGSPTVAPASLVATRTGAGTAQLTWNYSGPTENNFAYKIYQDGELKGTTTASQRSFTVTGLTSGRQVHFSVAATNDFCTLKSNSICYVDSNIVQLCADDATE